MISKIMGGAGSYSSSNPRREPVGKIWPNGEFSLGYRAVGQETDELSTWAWLGDSQGLTLDELNVRLECLTGWIGAVGAVYSVSGRMATLYLTLSNAPNSHKPAPRPKYGLKGLSGNGARMLRSGCFLLEDRLGVEDVVMVTLTVPRLPQPQRQLLASQWGVLTNRLVQYLSRELVRARRQPTIAGCVEVQSRRLESSGQAYLHLHLVCPAHSNAPGHTWAVEAGKLRTWWKDAIERVINYTLPHLPRVETALVETSVEAYLGKYLSKGGGEFLAAYVDDVGEEAVPGQWWFMSAPLKAAVKVGTRTGAAAGAVLDVVVNHLLTVGTGEGFDYIRHIDCLMSDRLVTVGWVGRLSGCLRDELQAMLTG